MAKVIRETQKRAVKRQGNHSYRFFKSLHGSPLFQIERLGRIPMGGRVHGR